MSRENLNDSDDSSTPDVPSNTAVFLAEQPDSNSSPLVISTPTSPNVPVVTIDAADSVNNDVSNCAVFCHGTMTAVGHVLDFAKITLVTQTLLSRWLHQLFLELERYDAAPSMDVQKTWLGYPIIGMAASLAVVAKIVNGRYSQEKYVGAEDYVAAIFRSAHFYFLLDLWAGAESMPLGWFIATSAIALPLLAAFFTKHALSDSDDHVYSRMADLDFISTSRVSTGHRTERPFNLAEGLHYGSSAISIFLWTLNREIEGKTLALPKWQWSLLVAGSLFSAKIGYDLTDHPKRFQLLAMGSKFLREGSLAYAAASGIFFMICRDNPACSSIAIQALLVLVCSVVAAAVGVYSGLTTRFRFEENCERIERVVSSIRNAPETVADGLAAIGNNVSGFFTSCCKKDEVSPELLTPCLP